MSEFELSTLLMVAMLLGGLGGYSYWQIKRAQRFQRKSVEPMSAYDEAKFSGHGAVAAQYPASKTALHPLPSDAPQASTHPLNQETKRYESVQNAYVPTGVGYSLDNGLDEEERVYVRGAAPVISPDPPVYGSKKNSAYDVKPVKDKHYAYEPELQTGAASPAVSLSEHRVELQDEQDVEYGIEHDIISYHLPESVALSNDALPLAVAATEVVVEAPYGASQTPMETLSSVVDEYADHPVDSIPVLIESPTLIEPPVEDIMLAADPQFFNQKDLTEQATFSVFDPLIRFSSWIDHAHPAPIQAIDGALDLMVSQPKNAHDIERALYDLRLDTDLPLRLYGLRAGQVMARHSDDPNAARQWQPLEQGALYNGLRLTLQLANASGHASTQLIHDWFELAQRLARRLAAHVHLWPDPAALASYAVYLHDVSKRLGAPLVVQLHKAQGLWPAYEVHQQMTQWGLQLDVNGQYVARNRDGRPLYHVLNDLNNPRAQDFYRDALATMHVQTLSFCLDLARVRADDYPQERLWHDMSQLAHALNAQWRNGVGNEIAPEILFSHAAEHVPAYVAQLAALGIPAGSLTMKRLLSSTAK